MRHTRRESGAPIGMVRRTLVGSIAAVIAVLGLVLASQPASAQISGEVIDIQTREPVPFANVALVDSAGNVWAQVTADSVGYFSVIPMTNDAVFNFQVIAMGYAGVEIDPIRYNGTPVHRTLGIMAQPLMLDGLDVEVEGQDIRLLLFGFYDRKARGYGHFIDEEQIRATVEPGVTGILRGSPSLFVRGNREVLAFKNLGRQANGLTMSMSGFNGVVRNPMAQFCQPTVFVNGSLDLQTADGETNDFGNATSGRSFNDWLPDKEDIIGVEVYRSMASLPRDLQIEAERFRPDPERLVREPQSTCGAILIWTRLERESGAGEGR